MSDTFTLTIDGKEIQAKPGQTILQAAEDAGVYIPRLCAMKDLVPHGSCRVCTVMVNGRPQAACTQPAAAGMIVESETESVQAVRRDIVDMLFVEGNHFCMFCEKSGNCELQGMAYRFGITAPRFPFLFPDRDVDASHPDIFIDRNRCILCGRCVRASRDLDGKHVFEFVGRGHEKCVAVNAEARLADTDIDGNDKALDVCPVGALLRKRVGFSTPVGKRLYDHKPIGSDIEHAGQE
ncbi:MAG: 2Fe-2S iron-sulfur cluster binding domain-containing protein [bacterium]|nr:2Fe-2S iron-sulfur cluster binding domain-containing protein [bacterium]